MAIVMGVLHHYSGAEGSLVKRVSYPLVLSLCFYLHKLALMTLPSGGRAVLFLEKHSTLIFLFIFSAGVTESTIFQSPHHYALSHT